MARWIMWDRRLLGRAFVIRKIQGAMELKDLESQADKCASFVPTVHTK